MRMRTTSIVSGVIAVALGVTLAAQAPQAPAGQGAQPAGRDGGQGRGGGGGRGGGRGFNLPALLMETDAFPDGGIVPLKYANAGGSTLPGFKISNAPAGTMSFAVIFHDIDVSLMGSTDDVLHMMAWNIPAASNGWSEGKLPEGSVMGNNLTGKPAYMGPGAPPGPRYHHYVWELYALNANLDLPPTATRAELLKAMEGKIVAKSAYVGRFRGEPPAGGAAPGGAPPAK